MAHTCMRNCICMHSQKGKKKKKLHRHTTAGTVHINTNTHPHSLPIYTHTHTHTSTHTLTQTCADPLAQLYLPQGQYVDYVRVADYCTVTVKETNVFHRQASISVRGLLAIDYSSK